MNYLSIKVFAMMFLFILMLCCMGVAVFDLVTGQSIQPVVLTILGAGIGQSITILGLNHGIDSINGTVSNTITHTISGMLSNDVKDTSHG